jgi:hypothetical protein
MLSLLRSFLFTSFFSGLFLTSCAIGQTISALTPSSTAAGSGGFVLSVFGNNFNTDSIVRLHTANGVQPLQTYFVNNGLLMAGVSAINIKSPGTLQIDVADYATQSSSNLAAFVVMGSGSSGSGSGSTGSGSGSGSSGSGSSGSTGSGSSSGSGSSCYGCYTPPSGGSSGSGSSGSGSGSSGSGSSGSGSSGGSTTSPSGSPLLVTVTSPSPNASVTGSVTIAATAQQTSNTDGSISSWAIYDGNNLLWVDENPDSSINVDLALSEGSHSLQVVAYDDSFTASTATVPVKAAESGLSVAWHACIETRDGQQYQAMQISPSQAVTGVLQSQMFWNSGCQPTQWTDQLNDVGQTVTFGAGSSYLYWFIHRADMPNVSAVWTIGNQSSGCVNYNTAPAC